MALDTKIRDQVATSRELTGKDLEDYQRLVGMYEDADPKVQEQFWVEYGAMEDGNNVKDAVYAYMMDVIIDTWGVKDTDQ